MPRLTITIDTDITSNQSEVVATMTDYDGVDAVVDLFNELFEVEMLGAEVVRGSVVSVIRVVTNNQDKVRLLERATMRTFLRVNNVPEFSRN